jgi:hypothetical protein
MAFALPVRIGQASVMPSMKQGNPPDSGLARRNRLIVMIACAAEIGEVGDRADRDDLRAAAL